MQYEIKAPAVLHHTAKLPASKSISNRVLVIHALTGGHTLPCNLSDCDDTEVIVEALKNNPYEINIKAAGTAMRFMTAFLAVKDGDEHVLTGTERMRHRPIGVLVDALHHLGADIQYTGEEGYPPLRIKGCSLEGGLLEVAGNISSQYISALLLIGPCLTNGLTLHMTSDVISRPYIDLTLWTDWSAASYWYEMMALTNNQEDEIKLTGLMDGSKQGDSQVRYLFSLLGVKTTFETKKEGIPTMVTLQHSGRCVPRLEYNFVNSPDLAQTFVVCCALLNVPFHFTGLSTLKIKETDRIEALKKEMKKLGYVVRNISDSELLWDGELCEPSLEAGINTYEDHRMALAFTPAALRFEGLRINNPQVVSKSYPYFWEDLSQCGFRIVEKSE